MNVLFTHTTHTPTHTPTHTHIHTAFTSKIKLLRLAPREQSPAKTPQTPAENNPNQHKHKTTASSSNVKTSDVGTDAVIQIANGRVCIHVNANKAPHTHPKNNGVLLDVPLTAIDCPKMSLHTGIMRICTTQTDQKQGQNNSMVGFKVFYIAAHSEKQLNGIYEALTKAKSHDLHVKTIQSYTTGMHIDSILRKKTQRLDTEERVTDVSNSSNSDSDSDSDMDKPGGWVFGRLFRHVALGIKTCKLMFFGGKEADLWDCAKLLCENTQEKINYLYVHKYASRLSDHFLSPVWLWRLIRPHKQIAVITGMCVCMCIHTCVSVCMWYMYVLLQTNVGYDQATQANRDYHRYMCVYLGVCVCEYFSVCISICLFWYRPVWLWKLIRPHKQIAVITGMCVCMCVSVCLCLFVYMYVCVL